MPEQNNSGTVNGSIRFSPFVRTADIKEALRNIKRNSLLILSWLTLLLLQIKYNTAGIISLPAAAVCSAAVFSQIPDIWTQVRRVPLYIKIYSFISTVGICQYSRVIANKSHSGTDKFDAAAALLGVDSETFFNILLYVLPVFAGISVFVICALLIRFLIDESSFALSKLTTAETAVYSVIALLTSAYVIYAFTGSRAFWGATYGKDIIFSSDSAKLVYHNAYLRLLHVENDIRQPLFALFAAPFAGFGYTLSLPFAFVSEPSAKLAAALYMDLVQTALFIAANYLLAVSAGLKPSERICFMLLFSSTYFYLLFSVMMEQYIVCYFWMVLAIYSYIKDGRSKELYLIASGGTLLTSFAFLPLGTGTEQEKRFPAFMRSCLKCAVMFLTVLCGAARLDVFFDLYYKYTRLSKFMGGGSLGERACQYTSFVASCFIPPEIMDDSRSGEVVSWLLSPDNSARPNIAGIIILILCAAGLVWDRRNRLTVISGLWCAFSAVLLIIAGWGAPENGMILYSLYFGWAFLLLIFSLIKHISVLTRSEAALPVISAALIILLAILNYGGISDLFRFAFKYYPLSV